MPEYILLRNDKKIYRTLAAARNVLNVYEPEYRSKYRIVEITDAKQEEFPFVREVIPEHSPEVLALAAILAKLLNK